MRIIVTNNGAEVVRSFSKDNLLLDKSYMKDDSVYKSTQAKYFNSGGKSQHSRATSFNPIVSMINFQNSNSVMNFSKHPKEVEVNIKKINLNRNSSEKYNQVGDTGGLLDSLLLPSLPEKLLKKLEKNNESIDQGQQGSPLITRRTSIENLNKNNMKIELYNVNDIIKEGVVHNLIQTTKEQKRMKDKQRKVGFEEFRTPYINNSKIKELKNIINDTVVASNNSSMIQYLGQMDKISSVLLDKIHKTNAQSQNKLNRICQRVFRNNSIDEMKYIIIKKSIQASHNNEKEQYFETIKEMGNELDEGKLLIDKYRNRKELNKEEVLDDKIKAIKENWNKLNVNRYYHKHKVGAVYDKIKKSIVLSHDYINEDSTIIKRGYSMIHKNSNKTISFKDFQD